jgi:hypothetical protein
MFGFTSILSLNFVLTHSYGHKHAQTHTNKKWFLCYYLQKYGHGSITPSMTGSALGNPNTTIEKIAAMNSLLSHNYTEWNTCMYVPLASNTNANFIASYPGVLKQIDCAATETYAGAATFTSCDAAITGGTVRPEYWCSRFLIFLHLRNAH